MTDKINIQFDKDTHLVSDKSYVRDKYIILGLSIIFFMLRVGAVVPDIDKVLKGFRIINLSKTITAFYLVWMYLYFSFYQKYWGVIEKEIIRSKKNIFKEKIAQNVLRETHKKQGHDFHWFEITSLHQSPILRFSISYSPVIFEEYGEDKKYGSRNWVIDLKLKHNQKYILPYLAEVYCRSPILTAYIIPFLFPIFAWFVCMLGDWAGSLSIIFSVFFG